MKVQFLIQIKTSFQATKLCMESHQILQDSESPGVLAANALCIKFLGRVFDEIKDNFIDGNYYLKDHIA
jgi:hypothetical protein